MKQPFPYQAEGAGVLAQHDRFGLHDEMGVGKTATTILAANAVGARRGIIICPAGLRENWIKEFKEFSPYRYRLCKGTTIHDFVAWQKGRFEILVTSYEMAVKWAKEIEAGYELLDFVAMDEAHYLKNVEAKRTKAILGEKCDGDKSVVTLAKHVWHVTGTAMANDPSDIFPFLSMCKAVGGMSFGQFCKEFFHKIPGAFGARYSPRDDRVLDLRTLIANNSIRRTKRDIGMQLPPVFLTTSVVDGNDEKIIALLKEHPGLDAAIVRSLSGGNLSFESVQHIGTLRRLIGEAKAVPYAHMLYDELLQGVDKRVVFGIHVDALTTVKDFLHGKGIGAVIVNGQTSDAARTQAVKSFQEDPECRVFVGNIRAAGVGLTLTAACELDVLESDWSPAGNAQAIMRIHRIGQTRHVRARFITLAKSFDVKVNEIVAEKTAAIAQIEGQPMNAAPDDVLEKYFH